MAQPASPPATAPGRREQKKAATRAALHESGRRLVAERGYDDVSVQQICDDAGAAHRTFYRYFEGKDDCLLADFHDFIEFYVALVEARPDDEHPMDSLIAAVKQLDAGMKELFGSGLSTQLAEGIVLVDTVPAVAGRQHWMAVQGQDRLTDHFAARLGVGADAPEPRWYAAASTAAYHVATRTWVRLPKRRQRTTALWDLAAESLEAFRRGLRP